MVYKKSADYLHHHLCLIKKIIFRHRTFLHGLDSNLNFMFIYSLCYLLQKALNNTSYSTLSFKVLL